MQKPACLPRLLLLSCLFMAWLLCAPAQAVVTLNKAIANQAQASFVEAASSKNATLASNKVKAVPPTAIRYYRDDQFSNEALASRIGRQLYVQASAAACNADEDAADQVRISITSKLTGDAEWFDAAETGPDTALFRIPRQVMTIEGGSQPVPGDGILQVQKNDTLMARIENCGSMAMSMLLIDPSGIVFDSRSDEPVAGATVAIIDVTGEGNGGNAGGPAKVFDNDGSPAPDTVKTGLDGRFEFPLVAPARYRLVVTPPPSYDFPSKLAPAALPRDRTIHLHGSYGGEFPVNASTGAVILDVPLDFDSSGLMLEKSASRQVVELADFLDYTLTVRNSGRGDLVQVAVRDRLPAGFRFEPGSLRVRGAKAADPVLAANGELVFPVGELAMNTAAVITFRVRVGPGALQGDGTSRGQAASGKPLPKTSNTATARVKVQAGVFSTKGFVVGSVFLDCNGNDLRDADEAGMPGVRILMEDGTSATTDADGRYSFSEVPARTHVLRLDGATLPSGARIGEGMRSRFVDLKNGELYKAEFAVDGCDAPVRTAVEGRRAQLSRAGAAVAPAAPAGIAAAPAADLDVGALDNTLDFVGLRDGAVLGGQQIPVRVKGATGSRFGLSVNGAAVPDTRLGRKLAAPERQAEAWEYIGIDLKPGANVLEVAQHDSFGNPRGTKRITVTVAASAAVIELAAQPASVPADGKSMAGIRVRLADANGVRVTAATPLTLEASRGAWQASDLDPREPGLQVMLEGGEADYLLQAPREEGEAVVRVRSGAASREIRLHFVPDLQPLIAAGLIEGAINVRHFRRDALAPVRPEDGFEDELRNVSRTLGRNAEAAARAAMFIKGKIRGDYLLTLGYDSEKAPDTRLFRDIDPNAFYPVYGDGAVRSFDAQSTSKLYVRIARDRSWLLYGDFTPPPATPARNLGVANRSLTGVREHYETDRVSVDAYASRASARQAIDEFPANGVSGPFLIRQRPMLANSERVEVLVRDRNQPALVLSATPLARLQDYEIEPVSGTLLLRAPLASLDPNLNPVSIRVTYEVDQGGAQFWVAGVNAQARVSERIEVGGSYATDRNPQDPATLKSANATLRLAEQTTLIAEVAQSDKASLGKGRAARVDFQHADGNLEARVHAGRADSQFDNLSASLGRGRTEAGARVAYRVDESTRLVGEAIHSADVASGAARDGVLAGTVTRFANGVQVEAGVRHARETAPANVTLDDNVTNSATNSVRTKVTAPVPTVAGATVFAELEQDVANAGRKTVAVGGDYQMAQGGRAYARHELISSLGSNYALNDSQQRNATVVGIDAGYMDDGRVFSEYRARDDFGGPVAEAAIGLRNLWRVDDGVAVSTSFERVQTLEGESRNTGIALTAALELTTNPDWKATARAEVRRSEATEGALVTAGIAARLSHTLTFLGKSTVAFQHGRQSGGLRADALLQTGLAYRSLESLGLNALAKYEYRLERDTSFANVRRAVHIIAANVNYQAARDTVYTLRYAGKRVHDQSAGLSSQTSAHLLGGRVGQNLGGRWDGSLLAQMLATGSFGTRQYGAGLEAGYRMRDDLWMSAGYNFAGFTDRDLSGGNYTSKGVYVRMRYQFDERALPDALNADAGMH